MKTTALLLAFSLTVGISSIAFAADPAKESKDIKASKPEKTPTVKQSDDRVLLTGSHIKQKVRRNGMVTDGASQVLVLDSETIQNSGASDLRELLNRRGIR